MTAKSETVGVGRSGWVPALKAQTRLMAELESRFKSGNSVPVERAYITAAEFAVIETYMEEDEALSTDLGMLNLRQHEQLQSLLTGLEALAGEWEEMSTEPGLSKDEIDKILTISMDHTLRDCAKQLRTLASTATNGELK